MDKFGADQVLFEAFIEALNYPIVHEWTEELDDCDYYYWMIFKCNSDCLSCQKEQNNQHVRYYTRCIRCNKHRSTYYSVHLEEPYSLCNICFDEFKNKYKKD